MSLDPGHKLGPYEIVGPAGSGGMGEVYKATDTRLDRMVAIKVMPSHLSKNEELRARFDREARTISNLSHPNICALYDVGHEAGVDFLVMEYLEGETLAQRLTRGPMPIEEILKLGLEICSSLDVAHRNGVIHRDLKPGNIMLTKTGAKLLDFGLAKIATTGDDLVSSTLTEMVTQPISREPLTGEGTILGTFQYMSPEQLEGKEVDARADVFALGAVLYEMATGKRAFEGGSQASLIAAILERTPPAISTIQPMTPPELDQIVRACLAKDRDERIQTAHDVGLRLRWIKEGGSQVGVPAAVVSSRKRRGRLGWGLAGLLAVAAIVLGWRLASHKPSSPVVLRAEMQFSEDLSPVVYWAGGSFALSPDGRQLAASCLSKGSVLELWVRDMTSGQMRRLEGTERALFPFWSPDSRQIAFFSNGKLKRIEAAGGSAVTVCDVPAGRGGSWNQDGVIIFGKSTTEGIYSVPEGGGVPTQITSPDTTAGIEDDRFPWFLPDGKSFLYTARGTTAAFLCVGSLDKSAPKQILPIRSNAVYSGGYVMYLRDNTLVARPFDSKSREFRGDARILAEPVYRHDGFAHGSFSMSNTGVLLFAKAGVTSSDQIEIIDRRGAKGAVISSETPLDDLIISRDGKMLAMSRNSMEGAGYDVWTYDLQRKLFSRITFAAQCDDPVFSPDGSSIAYSLDGNVVSTRASGVGKPTELYRSGNDDLPVDWSRDGKKILFLSVSDSSSDDVWAYDLQSGKAEPILNTVYSEKHSQFSPDGKWIAYTSNESGKDQIYLIDYPGLTQKIQVSRSGGTAARWRGDGAELYFVTLNDSMVVVSVNTSSARPTIGESSSLFATPPMGSRTHRYAVSPDGSTFYLISSVSDETNSELEVVVGWPSMVKPQSSN